MITSFYQLDLEGARLYELAKLNKNNKELYLKYLKESALLSYYDAFLDYGKELFFYYDDLKIKPGLLKKQYKMLYKAYKTFMFKNKDLAKLEKVISKYEDNPRSLTIKALCLKKLDEEPNTWIPLLEKAATLGDVKACCELRKYYAYDESFNYEKLIQYTAMIVSWEERNFLNLKIMDPDFDKVNKKQKLLTFREFEIDYFYGALVCLLEDYKKLSEIKFKKKMNNFYPDETLLYSIYNWFRDPSCLELFLYCGFTHEDDKARYLEKADELKLPQKDIYIAVEKTIDLDGFTGEKTIKFDTGSIYEGSFLDGLVHGYGTYKSSYNYEYKGYFYKGKMHGYGEIVKEELDYYNNLETVKYKTLWFEGNLLASIKDESPLSERIYKKGTKNINDNYYLSYYYEEDNNPLINSNYNEEILSWENKVVSNYIRKVLLYKEANRYELFSIEDSSRYMNYYIKTLNKLFKNNKYNLIKEAYKNLFNKEYHLNVEFKDNTQMFECFLHQAIEDKCDIGLISSLSYALYKNYNNDSKWLTYITSRYNSFLSSTLGEGISSLAIRRLIVNDDISKPITETDEMNFTNRSFEKKFGSLLDEKLNNNQFLNQFGFFDYDEEIPNTSRLNDYSRIEGEVKLSSTKKFYGEYTPDGYKYGILKEQINNVIYVYEGCLFKDKKCGYGTTTIYNIDENDFNFTICNSFYKDNLPYGFGKYASIDKDGNYKFIRAGFINLKINAVTHITYENNESYTMIPGSTFEEEKDVCSPAKTLYINSRIHYRTAIEDDFSPGCDIVIQDGNLSYCGYNGNYYGLKFDKEGTVFNLEEGLIFDTIYDKGKLVRITNIYDESGQKVTKEMFSYLKTKFIHIKSLAEL